MEYRHLNMRMRDPHAEIPPEKPERFEEMKRIAEDLSKEFPCVRVDLYWVNHRAYFGELTFYPWTGYVVFDPREFDMILGEKFILPEKLVD